MCSKEKYKLTEELKLGDYTLYRIQATKDFETIAGTVHKGDLGGWIESEFNLSQENNCWVFDEAKVYQMAQVYDNAIVADKAIVRGCAKVFNDATVKEEAFVIDRSCICDSAIVGGVSRVYGDAEVYEDARLFGEANVGEYAKIYGKAVVIGKSDIKGYSKICNTALVSGKNYITGASKILGEINGDDVNIENSIISQDTKVTGTSVITGSKITGKVEIADESVIVNSHIYATCRDIKYINQEIQNKRIILSDPLSLSDTQTDLMDILQNALFKEI